ncbi:MAG: hypothetical protein K9M98_07615 [Cephaloticoccus sp.]|nr:hypothetical protein [Cephaloticoccus sp.]
MRQPKGESVTIKVLVLGLKLFAKVMPIMLVGFIAYYSYTSYFGELPFIDNFKRKAAGMVGIKMAPPPAVKKKAAVTQMMDKAKDVVKANNRSVDFANALADDNVDMDKLTHLANAAESGMDINAAVTALAKAGEQAPAAEGEGGPQASPDPAAVNPAATGPTAEAKPKGKDPTGAVMGMLEEMSLVKVASEIEPMVKFRIWVGKANVSGVMDGASPKAYVNGYVYDKDEIIDEDLGISIEGVQGAGSILVFKDKTGALLGKLY